MHDTLQAVPRVQATLAWAQAALPAPGGWIALHLGNEASALALEGRAIGLDLGLATLARRFFASDRPGESAIERAITEVEERIMPLRPSLPAEARLLSTDPAVAEVAAQAGLSMDAGPVTLDRDTVEALFNRWAALALGRPASQDALPVGGPVAGRFAATLLVLREWLHHLPQSAITVAPAAPSLPAFSYPQPVSGVER